MKSTERKVKCPFCLKEVSADWIKNHIAQLNRIEKLKGKIKHLK
jgi:hypothetical protein